MAYVGWSSVANQVNTTTGAALNVNGQVTASLPIGAGMGGEGTTNLILAPSLNLNFALFGQTTLDPRISFLRTSNATLTNSAGLITYAPMNLLTFSEQFDNAAWGKNAVTISANLTTAPNGTTTADKIQETAVTNYFAINQNPSGVYSTTYTWSCYAKASERNFIALNFSVAGCSGTWNLTTGVNNITGGTANATFVGDGWWRLSATFTTPASGLNVLYHIFGPSINNAIAGYAGVAGNGIFAWGAQLEIGSTATTYNSTTVKNLLGFTQEFDNAAWTKSNSFVQTNLLLQSEDFLTTWATTNLTVTTNTQIAPTGNLTADTLADTVANANHNTLQSIAWAATSYTFSAYVKYNTHRWIGVRIGATGNQFFGSWDLQNNVVGSATVGSTIGMTFVGNGWYRITLTATLTSAATANLIIQLNNADAIALTSYAGTGTSFYIWGAQIVQGAVAGDYVRTSSTVMPVMYQAPNGTLSADKLVEDSANITHFIAQAATVAAGTPYTLSVYAKESQTSPKRYLTLLLPSTQFGSNKRATFDLATGTLNAVNSPTTATMTNAGNGWWRCEISATATVSGATGAGIRLFNAATDTLANYTGDGTSGIYIWGAQLSDSASLDSYVYNPVAAPTAQAYYGARFDYDPVTLQPKGLLIEEQRTNLILQSEAFDNASWIPTNITVATNATIAPSGTLTADKIAEDSATGDHRTNQSSLTINGASTYSVYAKASERTVLRLQIDGTVSGAVSSVVVDVNVSTGVAATPVIFGNITSSAVTVSSVGNGWYKIALTFTLSASSTVTARIFLMQSIGGATSYAGTTGSGLFVWGAQLEVGAFATSYIPTQASQVTRAADTAVIQGSNFSSWYNQNEGTVYSEFTGRASGIILNVSNGTFSSRLPQVAIGSISNYESYVVANGSITASLIPAGTHTYNTYAKISVAYQTNNCAASVNGSAVASATSVALPYPLSQMDIGAFQNNTNKLNGYIKSINYYPTRLTNPILQTITS